MNLVVLVAEDLLFAKLTFYELLIIFTLLSAMSGF